MNRPDPPPSADESDMAKKKPAKPEKPARPAHKPLDPAALARRRATAILTIKSLAALALGGLLTVAVVKAKAYVVATDSDVPPTVELSDRPVWMSDLVAQRILANVRPETADGPFDRNLLKSRAALLADSPWVREVRQVRRVYGPGGDSTLLIDCDFRAPVALVAWHDHHWLVDRDGVMLPEGFSADQVDKVVYGTDGRVNVRRILGAANPPAGAGKPWPGGDVKAALDLLDLVNRQPFGQDVVGVDVANFDRRKSPTDAQLVLLTRHGTRVRWGRPVNAQDFLVEVSAAEKLRRLAFYFKEYGRVDAKHQWIDLRFDNEVPVGNQ